MNLPESFINRIEKLLKDETASFLSALQADSPVSIRINNKKSDYIIDRENVAWCPSGFYLPERPLFTMDPLFHAGCYYVQEAGSMFLEQAVRQYLNTEDPMALDLCAAPGGKSTHIASLLDGKGLLVSNEIIRSRAKILQENVCKWGMPNVIVTNNDPADFSDLTGFFDLLVVDAPCSGEGLFRKDPQSINEWSVENARHCAARQKRILADVFPALKTGGVLIYSTCTYNEEENEKNVEWMINELGAEYLPVSVHPNWNITDTGLGYRFYPHKTKSEGFFLAALRKTKDEKTIKLKPEKNKSEKQQKVPSSVTNWFSTSDFEYKLYPNDEIKAIPSPIVDRTSWLEKQLNILQSGTLVAQLKGKDILPQQALAFSGYLNQSTFPIYKLNWQEAIVFLKKESLEMPNTPVGFVLVTFQGAPLGWVKNLGNRTNNLYPSEWRIRMEADREKYKPIVKTV